MTRETSCGSGGRVHGLFATVLVAALLVAGASANAQEAPPNTNGWQYQLTLFGWGAGLSGSVGPAIKQYQAHVSFGDILKNLKFGAMFHFEAQSDKWGIMVDPIYMNLGKTVEKQGRFRDRSIDLDLEQFILEVAGIYRFYQSPKATFDFTFGGRYNELKVDLTPQRFETLHKSYAWTDPVVGVKGSVKLSKVWSFGYRADAGGFGVGSWLTWSGVAQFNAQFSRHTSLGFGYIALHDNYVNGSGLKAFNYDVTMSGPFLGVAFKW